MKLNYKRTILVGFAFFLICAFWQAYDGARGYRDASESGGNPQCGSC